MQEYIRMIEMIVILFIGLMNVYTCHLYYRDKQYSRTGQYRISERKLLQASFLFGGLGAFLGMRFFRHKTKHRKFQFWIPITAVFTVGVWAWLVSEVLQSIQVCTKNAFLSVTSTERKAFIFIIKILYLLNLDPFVV